MDADGGVDEIRSLQVRKLSIERVAKQGKQKRSLGKQFLVCQNVVDHVSRFYLRAFFLFFGATVHSTGSMSSSLGE